MSDSIENFDWAELICPACGCQVKWHNNTQICRSCETACYSVPTRELAWWPKVRIYQERKPDSMQHHLWRGGCTACLQVWSYWHGGAALGMALQHTRTCSRFRYAISLDPSYQSPVSSAQRLLSSSGRQRTGSSLAGPSGELPSLLSPYLTGRIKELVAAPWGRCSVCKAAKVPRIQMPGARLIYLCEVDGSHGR